MWIYSLTIVNYFYLDTSFKINNENQVINNKELTITLFVIIFISVCIYI